MSSLPRFSEVAFAETPAVYVPAARDKACPDILARNAEAFGKSSVPVAGFVKASCLVSIKGRRNVLAMVIRLAQDLKVLDAVVGLVPILVVNVLMRAKRAAKVAFHHNAVFVSLPAVHRNYPIPGLIQPMLELAGELARLRAELTRRRAGAEICAAMGATAWLFHALQNTLNHRCAQA